MATVGAAGTTATWSSFFLLKVACRGCFSTVDATLGSTTDSVDLLARMINVSWWPPSRPDLRQWKFRIFSARCSSLTSRETCVESGTSPARRSLASDFRAAFEQDRDQKDGEHCFA